MSEQHSECLIKTKQSLEQIKQKLIDLSTDDFSKIHVDQEWSYVSFVKDHIDFLIEQTEGLLTNLKDGEPKN